MRTLWRRCFIDNSYNDKAKFDRRLRSVKIVFINMQVNSRLTLRLNWNPSSEFDFTEPLSLSVSELLALFLPACLHDKNEKDKQDNKWNTMERNEQTLRALSDGFVLKFFLFLLHQFIFGFLHFHTISIRFPSSTCFGRPTCRASSRQCDIRRTVRWSMD
jgi:hypothetical protein